MTEIKNTSVIDFNDVDDTQMNEMIDNTLTEFDNNDLVKGKVVQIERDEVLVDIGFKSEGVIPVRELSIRKDANPADIVNIGDEIEALVLQKEDQDGRLILSKRRAEYERSWAKVEEKFKAGEVVTGEVIEVVKGGLILDIGLRGFLPASLVDLHRVKDLDSYKGTEIEARVIEMDKNRNNVVLSRRVLLEEGRRAERAEILGKLSRGMRLKGKVSSIVDFGAFVDLGGIDGLVHISELSWNHVNHPSDVVSVGDEVEVMVLDVDLQRERISLGLKQTTEDPWAKLVENYPVGSIVEGTVTKIVTFGAFVSIDEQIEGLVHISEMAPRRIESPNQVVHVGDKVQVKVIEVNPSRRRVSLSMKAAAAELGIEVDVDEPEASSESVSEAKADAGAEGGVADSGASSEDADAGAKGASEKPADGASDVAGAEDADANAGAGDDASASEAKDGTSESNTDGSKADVDAKPAEGADAEVDAEA